MSLRSFGIALVGLSVALGAAGIVAAAEQQRKCAMDREYYLYTPDTIDPARTYWLVVGVHGKGGVGKGAAGMAGWARKGNVIVIGPSFPDGYQVLNRDTDRQLQDLFAALQKEFRLYPKMFLYGFSGGSQFTHRFAMKYPDLVVGCSSHSGGSWTDTVGPKAAAIPFAISCGEKDTEKSTFFSPRGRYEWCQKFARQLEAADFYFKVRFWPDVAHSRSPGSVRMTEECFALATTGMYEEDRQAVQKEVEAIRALIASGDFAQALEAVGTLQPPAGAAPASGPAGPGAKAKPAETPPAEPALADAKPLADPAGGNRLPTLQENAHGWHEGAQGKAALDAVRRACVGRQAHSLSEEIEKAALDKVAAIEKAKPADAAARLEGLQKIFRTVPKTNVTAAVTKALAGLSKP